MKKRIIVRKDNRDLLIEHYIKLVDKHINNYNGNLEKEDLRQDLIMGMIECVDSYLECEKNYTLSQYINSFLTRKIKSYEDKKLKMNKRKNELKRLLKKEEDIISFERIESEVFIDEIKNKIYKEKSYSVIKRTVIDSYIINGNYSLISRNLLISISEVRNIITEFLKDFKIIYCNTFDLEYENDFINTIEKKEKVKSLEKVEDVYGYIIDEYLEDYTGDKDKLEKYLIREMKKLAKNYNDSNIITLESYLKLSLFDSFIKFKGKKLKVKVNKRK